MGTFVGSVNVHRKPDLDSAKRFQTAGYIHKSMGFPLTDWFQTFVRF